MQHYTIQLQNQFPLTCSGNILFHKLGFHLLDLKTLWKCSPEMVNQLLSLADACSASVTWIKLAILNLKKLYLALWFMSYFLQYKRPLAHWGRDASYATNGTFFIKRLWGEGSIHQHPHISCAALPPACRVLILMPFILSVALHAPSVGKAWPGALQGRAKQPQGIQKLQLMKQEVDYAITLTHKKESTASYPGKVVGLCNWAEQSRRGKNNQKAESPPQWGGDPAIAGPALGK